ncbi:EKC/KEOPS complex subunit Tp53rkb-like isoform X2 [Eriocheir sinensis]|nr:EKC/KEOPS complex subunit Tp53rkb-like isoform X2 [Eriocheir sinensis]
MGRQLITQGAEGRVYIADWLGHSVIIKERFAKKYRHADLDTHITNERIKAEARALTRCRSLGIRTPAVYDVNFDKRELVLENIANSITVRNYIYSATERGLSMDSGDMLKLAEKIGKILAKMHANHIIHGDLTTSNMLLVQPYDSSEVILIDFGLSSVEERAEDKAVDLYVLERAVLSTHPNTEAFVSHLISAYEKAGGNAAGDVVKRLGEVRTRGRKKLCFG